jgi:sodium-dependent dicarboxylate transporter 2/3/5
MKGFCLGVAYACSAGGAGSLVGTQPNLILKGFFDANYPKAGLNFLSYMAFALPVSAILVVAIWIVLALLWLPKRFISLFKHSL